MAGLSNNVRKNVALRFSRTFDCDDFFDQQMLNFYVRLVSRNQDRRQAVLNGMNSTDDENDNNNDDDEDDDDDDDDEPNNLPCAPS